MGSSDTSETYIEAASINQFGIPVVATPVDYRHASIISEAIKNQNDLILLLPTLKDKHLHLLLLEAFNPAKHEDGRSAVFIMSSDTSIRQNYLSLCLKSVPFSQTYSPVANITSDGFPKRVARHPRGGDVDDRVLYSRASTRLPDEGIGLGIKCFLYVDDVKFTEERFQEIQQWRERCEIPSTIYITSDPLSPLFDSLDDIPVWSWSPEMLQRVCRSAETAPLPPNGRVPEGQKHTNEYTREELNLLKQKIKGVNRHLYEVGGRNLNDLFKEAYNHAFRLKSFANEQNLDEIRYASNRLIGIIRKFESALCPVQYLNKEYPSHIRYAPDPIPVSIARARRHCTGLDRGPASHATGIYQTAINTIEDLYESWSDEPIEHTKTGALVTLLYDAANGGGETLVVTPDKYASNAILTYLKREHPRAYLSAIGDFNLITQEDLVTVNPAVDRLVLYGAPQWKYRYLLVNAIASEVVILAYREEKGLLRTQLDLINKRLKSVAERREEVRCLVGNFKDITNEWEEISYRGLREDDTSSEDTPLLDEIRSIHTPSDEKLSDLIEDLTDVEIGVPPRDSKGGDEVTDEGDMETDSREVMAIRVNFEGSYTTLFDPAQILDVQRYDNHWKKVPKDLKQGDVVFIPKQLTDDVRDTIRQIIFERGDVELVVKANVWLHYLQTVIEEENVSFDEFTAVLRKHGLDHREVTLKRWYNGEVDYTRAKEDMRKLAEIFELQYVQENFDEVWRATQKLKQITNKLFKILVTRVTEKHIKDEDEYIDEELDLRLSDFEELIDTYVVKEVCGTEITDSRNVGRVRNYVEIDGEMFFEPSRF